MKFKYTDYRGTVGPYTAEEAVKHEIIPGAYTCDGQLERLEAKVDALAAIVGRLIDAVPCRSKAEAERLASVIGCCWEVEFDQ